MNKIVFAVEAQNQASNIVRCLRALQSVPYFNKQIIVIDDASVDDTCLLAEPYADKIIKKSQQETGFAGSRNIALRESAGAYLFIIDADIEITQLDPQTIIDFFYHHPKVIALSGRYLTVNGDISGKLEYNKLLDVRRERLYFKANKTYVYDLRNYATFSGGMCCIDNTDPQRLIAYRHHQSLHADDLMWQIELLRRGYQFAHHAEFRALHHHVRDHKKGMLKNVLEAKGSVWLAMMLLGQGELPPLQEQLGSVPLLMPLGIAILGKWPLAGGMSILLGISPYIWVSLSDARLTVKEKIAFVHYFFIKQVLHSYYYARALVGPGYSLQTRLRLLWLGCYSDICAKGAWIRRALQD